MISLVGNGKKWVKKPDGKTTVLHENGITDDIVKAVLDVYRSSYWQVDKLGKLIGVGSDESKLLLIYDFVKSNIQYKLDPPGEQYIPTPARVVHQGFADCKGLSILMASLLEANNFNHFFRFVSYSGDKYTHVYNVVKTQNGHTYVLDACMPGFNREKPYVKHQDYMARIMAISGVSPKTIFETPISIGSTDTEEAIALRLMAERVNLEQAIAGEISGIGSPEHEAYNEAIIDYQNAINALNNGSFDEIEQIGDAIGRRNKRYKRAETNKSRQAKKSATNSKKANRRERRANFIKKVGQSLKRAGSGVQRVVATPLRIAVRTILPVMAPFFLYLFITDQSVINQLPEPARRKRAKAVRLSRFIINGLKMKESTFMSVVRNGIMKKYKRTPEQILSVYMQTNRLSAAFLVAAGPVLSALQSLITLLKRKPDEQISENDMPDPERDFATATTRTKRKVRTNLLRKSATQRGEEPNDILTEAAEENAMKRSIEMVDEEDEDIPIDEPVPLAELDNEDISEAEHQNLKKNTVKTTKAVPAALGADTQKSGNWILPAAAVAAALLIAK